MEEQAPCYEDHPTEFPPEMSDPHQECQEQPCDEEAPLESVPDVTEQEPLIEQQLEEQHQEAVEEQVAQEEAVVPEPEPSPMQVKEEEKEPQVQAAEVDASTKFPDLHKELSLKLQLAVLQREYVKLEELIFQIKMIKLNIDLTEATAMLQQKPTTHQ